MEKIIQRIKEQYYKWLHKRKCRAIEKFRARMMEVYPDGEKFLSRLQLIDEVEKYGEIFELRGHFCATGSMSAYGLQSDYQRWESDTIKEIERKYPDLKVLVFHYTPRGESVNH